jgi:hypothetical protein
MKHLRIALFNVTSGTAEEAIEIARKGFRPIFEAQPGFVRYDVGTMDDGGIVSFSVWDTADEAKHAVEMAHEFVRDNLADRLEFRDEHVGDVAWDDPE